MAGQLQKLRVEHVLSLRSTNGLLQLRHLPSELCNPIRFVRLFHTHHLGKKMILAIPPQPPLERLVTGDVIVGTSRH